ncbi:hypothetical protein PspLS_11940 [Pyricularia sp. CBS 133598]|nr:hypothetical protein PspLS_11940 [Pyricularia sp. CBS 133598]
MTDKQTTLTRPVLAVPADFQPWIGAFETKAKISKLFDMIKDDLPPILEPEDVIRDEQALEVAMIELGLTDPTNLTATQRLNMGRYQETAKDIDESTNDTKELDKRCLALTDFIETTVSDTILDRHITIESVEPLELVKYQYNMLKKYGEQHARDNKYKA